MERRLKLHDRNITETMRSVRFGVRRQSQRKRKWLADYFSNPDVFRLEAYAILKAKFAALTAVGPIWAAKIAQEQGEDFQQSQRSAFEYAQALFSAVKQEG
jgi:hypothetical protein